MLTRMVKWISIVALLALAVLQSSAGNWTFVAALAVCAGGFVVFMEAMGRRKILWAAIFFGICLLFNPLVPVTLPRNAFLAVNVACMGAFLLSLYALRVEPRMSIASITDRTPGSESL